MALEKRFLRPKKFVKKQFVLPGILLAVNFSLILYAWAYYFREFMRILTGLLGGGLLVELSSTQNFIYNFFYALITNILSFYIFLKFVLENSYDNKNKKFGIKQKQIISESGFFSLGFLSVFTKMLIEFSILFLLFPLQLDIDFLNEFPVLFILLPVVLFFDCWKTIIRTVGRKAYRWQIISLLSIAGLSLIYANINFIDYKSVNSKVKKSKIEIANRIEVPRSKSYTNIFPKYLAINMFAAYDSIQNEINIFDENGSVIPSIYEISDFLTEIRENYDSLDQQLLRINLHADRNMPYHYIYAIEDMLRKAQIKELYYALAASNSKYPSHYNGFKYIGIKHNLYQPYSQELNKFLDKVEKLDFSKYTFRLPEQMEMRTRTIISANRIKVEVTKDGLYLNDTEVNQNQLRKAVYSFIKNYYQNYLIIYEPSGEITYGRYIEILDLLYSTVDRLRNEKSMELFDETYFDHVWGVHVDSIKSMYPYHVLEWTHQEKRLLHIRELEKQRRKAK